MDAVRLLEFMREHQVAVEASVSESGGPQAAVVGVAFTDEFEIVFDTTNSTRKAANLRRNPRLAFVIGGVAPGEERTVQFEGIADEPRGAELDRVRRVYFDVYPDGPSRLRWPGIMYVRVRPTWIRYSDYTVDPPEIVEFSPGDLSR